MTNKKFKLAAMSLATAVAVSAVGPSASAVTYYLGDGSVTVDKDDTRGAYSYQGEDGSEEHRTYVNEDEADHGTIYVKGGNAPTGDVTPPTDNSGNGTEETTTGNTITVKEDVKEGTTSTDHTTDSSADNTENNTPTETAPGNTITVKEDVKDATIVVDGVNVDTSTSSDTSTEVPADTKEDKTIIKVGEGADVDLTVRDSNLTTGGHGIDIGVNLDEKDDNKETNVDLTLDNTEINLTEKDNTAGIVARDHSKVDVTLKGENTIDGKEALEDAAQEAEAAKKEGKSSPNRNVEGIRVGGENAGDDSKGKGASLTIKGDETSDQGSLNIDHTSTGMVISNGSDVTLTDNADVDIKHTEAGSSTQGGRGIVQRGDLTVEDKSSLTIDTVGSGAYKIDNDQEGLVYGNNGYGIDSTDDITVKGDSTLEIKGTQSSAIYGGTGSSLTVEDSTLNIDSNGRGIDYEGGAGDITFEDSKVNISGNGMGISVAPEGGTLTYDYKADNTLWPVNEQGDKLTNFLLTKDDAHANFDALSYNGQTYTYLSDLNKETGKQYLSVWVPAAALNYMLDVDGSHDPEIIGKALEELKQAGYNFDTAYQTAENGDQVVILRDMVVNGKSLNFTKTTDAEGNTKLIWGNYEKQAEGAPSAYDMVYGTEYEYEGKTYTIVWGYESQNNPNTTAAAGVLDAFGPDSNVKVTGENIDGTDSAQYTVTIYGALREVTDPVIPTNPEPETPEDSDPTPPAPTTPTTPAVQDARPTTSAVEQAVAKTTPAPETPVNPPVQDARPESGKLIQTGTTNWMADVLVRAGGVLLAAGYLLERKRKSMFHKAQH